MASAQRLIELGLPPVLAKEISDQIEAAQAAPSAAAIEAAIAAKTEIAALTGASTAGDIVTALQA